MHIIVFILVVVLLTIWAFLHWYQSKILFNPLYKHVWIPDIPYKEFTLKGVHGWYFNNYPENKTILHNHCNYGNISYLKDIIHMADKQQLNIIVYDYYGYGKSKGQPHPELIYTNGEMIYDYLTNTLGVHPQNVIVWGESLGGAVATHIASKYPCSSLVLLATFASLNDLFVDKFPKFTNIMKENVMKKIFHTLPSKDKIQSVNCPIIIIHSDEDNLIPITNAIKMYDSIKHQDKLFIKIKGDHSTPNINVRQVEEIFEFCGTDISRCFCLKDILEEIAKKDIFDIKDDFGLQ
jgi:uncharacterized protein